MTQTVQESTRREYAARMNRVVDHIQAHLADPLDLETLAHIACFSPFHFHRLFRGWMGETLQDFVLRLRLERAAQRLLFDRGASITAIALECGFSSSSSFARAFKAYSGVSASTWRNRKNGQGMRKDGKASEDPKAGSLAPGAAFRRPLESPMIPDAFSVQVRPLSPATLAYVRHVGPYMGDVDLFRRLFMRLFSWAGPRNLLGPNTLVMSLYHDNPNLTPQAKHRLEVALTVPHDTVPEGEIGIMPLEGGPYAVVRARLLAPQFAEAWNRLVADWLPGSGYQPDHRPALEIYRNNPDEDPEHRYDVELCLPVKPL